MSETYDAVVVGSGPNGLAAAITLAQAKCSVLLIEANSKVGGSCASEELTLPGFIHDVCSNIHPMAVASPFFRSLSLKRSILKWLQPDVPLAHPLENGKCALLHQSLATQGTELGADGKSWVKTMGPMVADWEKLLSDALQPLLHLLSYLKDSHVPIFTIAGT